jgi:hypothetical protein
MSDDALQGMLDEMTKLRMFDKHFDPIKGPEN